MAVVIGACMGPANAQPFEWREVGFGQRSGAPCAFDSSRGVVVAFGGLDFTGGYHGDVREWDGASWLERSAVGPAGRISAAAAYDEARGETVIFGGAVGRSRTASAETWGWNGRAWTLRASAGPSPRSNAGMAFDSARGVLVLFGGQLANRTSDGETWEWDGAVWTRRSTTGPSARYGHGMSFDRSRGTTVLFGGRLDAASLSGETWEWNGQTWTFRSAEGPAARLAHAQWFDPDSNLTYVTLGYAAVDALHDAWAWDGQAWTPADAPTSLGGRGAVAYDSNRRTAVLAQGGGPGEMWERADAGWVRVTAAGPAARVDASMCFDQARGVSVLVGGSPSTNETWEFDGFQWTRRAARSPFVQGCPMVYDSRRGRTVLFARSATWEWNGDAWTLINAPGPSTRDYAAMAYDSGRGVTVLFGGYASTYNAETWEWDGTRWSQRQVAAPPPRRWHAMAFDESRGVTVLYGGYTPTGPSNETWEWDGSLWTRRTATGPGPRHLHSLVYDSRRRVVVLGPGDGPSDAADAEIWEWNGAAWSLRQVAPAVIRIGHAAAYDRNLDAIVLFGGQPQGGSSTDTTMTLRTACSAGPTVSPPPEVAVCGGGSAVLSALASGVPPLHYQWLRNGAPIADIPGRISGVASSSLTITGARPDDAGDYSLLVTDACGMQTSTPARLAICAADRTCDGFLDFFDYDDFIQAFETGGADADFNADGFLDFFDYADFATAFETGC